MKYALSIAAVMLLCWTATIEKAHASSCSPELIEALDRIVDGDPPIAACGSLKAEDREMIGGVCSAKTELDDIAIVAEGMADECRGHTTPIHWFSVNPFAYQGKNVHGTHIDHAPEQKMSPAFFWLLVNFAIVLFLLRSMAVPKLKRFAEKRHYDIKDALEESAKLKQAAEKELATFDAKLDKVQDEADKLTTDIRESAKAERERVIAEAQEQAKAAEKAANQQIQADRNAAKMILQQEIAGEAIAIASKKVKDNANAQDNAALVDNFIASLEKLTLKEVR